MRNTCETCSCELMVRAFVCCNMADNSSVEIMCTFEIDMCSDNKSFSLVNSVLGCSGNCTHNA